MSLFNWVNKITRFSMFFNIFIVPTSWRSMEHVIYFPQCEYPLGTATHLGANRWVGFHLGSSKYILALNTKPSLPNNSIYTYLYDCFFILIKHKPRIWANSFAEVFEILTRIFCNYFAIILWWFMNMNSTFSLQLLKRTI